MFKIVSIYTGFPMAERVCAALKEAAGGQPVVFENIADDAVLGIIRNDGCITPTSFQRIEHMVRMADLAKPDLILGTCSSIGGVFDALAQSTNAQLLRIDLPMAEKAVEVGSSVVVVGTNMSTIGPSCEIVERKAKEVGKDVKINYCVLDKLFPLLKSEGKEAAVAYAVEQIQAASGNSCDVVMLAQASLTSFQNDLSNVMGKPVLASIPLCAEYIKKHYFSQEATQ